MKWDIKYKCKDCSTIFDLNTIEGFVWCECKKTYVDSYPHGITHRTSANIEEIKNEGCTFVINNDEYWMPLPEEPK